MSNEEKWHFFMCAQLISDPWIAFETLYIPHQIHDEHETMHSHRLLPFFPLAMSAFSFDEKKKVIAVTQPHLHTRDFLYFTDDTVRRVSL